MNTSPISLPSVCGLDDENATRANVTLGSGRDVGPFFCLLFSAVISAATGEGVRADDHLEPEGAVLRRLHGAGPSRGEGWAAVPGARSPFLPAASKEGQQGMCTERVIRWLPWGDGTAVVWWW